MLLLIKCWWLRKSEKQTNIQNKIKKTVLEMLTFNFCASNFLVNNELLCGFLLPFKILGVPVALSCPALVKIKSALRYISITFYAGFFTLCHSVFWSFPDSAEEVWYFHADSSLVLLPGVRSCAGCVSGFLLERFWGRDGTGQVGMCISILHVRKSIYKKHTLHM